MEKIAVIRHSGYRNLVFDRISGHWDETKVRFFHSKLISRLFNPALNPADNDQFTQMSFFHRFQFVN